MGFYDFMKQSCNDRIKITILVIELLKITSICICKLKVSAKTQRTAQKNHPKLFKTLKNIVYSEDIEKSFKAKLEYKRNFFTRVLRIFAPYRFLYNLGLDFFHILYMLMQLNESNSLSEKIFAVIISVSVLKTVLKCYFVLDNQHIKSELMTSLFFGPLTSFLEFLYFDRQIDVGGFDLPIFGKSLDSVLPSAVKFGFFVSVLDFMSSLIDAVINDALLRTECDDSELKTFAPTARRPRTRRRDWFSLKRTVVYKAEDSGTEDFENKNSEAEDSEASALSHGQIIEDKSIEDGRNEYSTTICTENTSRTLFNFCEAAGLGKKLKPRKEPPHFHRNNTPEEQLDSTYLMYFTSVMLLMELTRITYFSKMMMTEDVLDKLFQKSDHIRTSTNDCNDTLSSRKSLSLLSAYFVKPFFQAHSSFFDFGRALDHGQVSPCEDFSECFGSYSPGNPNSQFVFDMFLYDPIRVYFCYFLLVIHYIPLFSLLIQFSAHQCVLHLKCFGSSFKSTVRSSQKEMISTDRFVKNFLDSHLTNYLAHLISLVFLSFIIINDLQYHDGFTFSTFKNAGKRFEKAGIFNGFLFFMLNNLTFLTFISNALIANGPLKSIPENMYTLFLDGIKNSLKYPFISLGKLTTLLVSVAQLYFLLFWIFKLMPSNSLLNLSWHGPYCWEYAIIIFCILWTVAGLIICVLQKEELKPAAERTLTVANGTFCGENKLTIIKSIVGLFLFGSLCALVLLPVF